MRRAAQVNEQSIYSRCLWSNYLYHQTLCIMLVRQNMQLLLGKTNAAFKKINCHQKYLLRPKTNSSTFSKSAFCHQQMHDLNRKSLDCRADDLTTTPPPSKFKWVINYILKKVDYLLTKQAQILLQSVGQSHLGFDSRSWQKFLAILWFQIVLQVS